MLDEIKKNEIRADLIAKVTALFSDEDIFPKCAEQVLWREDNENIVVAFNPLAGVINFMNATLAIIFKLCDGKNSKNYIIQSVEKLFPKVNEQTIKNDVESALVQLFTNGYIEVCAADGEIKNVVPFLQFKSENN